MKSIKIQISGIWIMYRFLKIFIPSCKFRFPYFAILSPFFILLTSCQIVTTNVKNKKDLIQIEDMTGRVVIIPSEINSIFGSDITTTLFINSLAPEKLVGINFPISDAQKKYLNKEIQELPLLGNIFYGKSTLNLEKLAVSKPDIIVCPIFKHTSPEYIKDFESYGKKLNIPIVMVSLELNELPNAFKFMGDLLGKKSQADSLIGYCNKTYQWIKEAKKKITTPVSVYIAEGNNGLHTIPAYSTHSEIIEYAGITNCARVNDDFGYKDMQISLEQIITWQPDYILVSDRSATNKINTTKNYIKTDKAWQLVQAVQKDNILTIPFLPYNWIGRPPSINRLLGIKWLASSLYPEIAKTDMTKEAREFYHLFYHVDLTTEQSEQLLQQSNY